MSDDLASANVNRSYSLGAISIAIFTVPPSAYSILTAPTIP